MWRILICFITLFSLVLLTCSSADPTEEQSTSVVTDSVPISAISHLDTLPFIHTDTFDLNYLRGRFDPGKHPDFVAVDPALTDRDGTYYLRKDATEAFIRMEKAAAEDSISLRIVSATRNFDRQKSIWEAKWNGQRLIEGGKKAPEIYPEPVARALAILRWSSMPGTSRHHWGTDIDINRLTNDYFEQGRGLREYEWLVKYAADYGFCQTYSAKGDQRPYGYNEEKWHWSYLPVATKLTKLAQTKLTDTEIDGFDGAEVATEVKVVERYILGINPSCHF